MWRETCSIKMSGTCPPHPLNSLSLVCFLETCLWHGFTTYNPCTTLYSCIHAFVRRNSNPAPFAALLSKDTRLSFTSILRHFQNIKTSKNPQELRKKLVVQARAHSTLHQSRVTLVVAHTLIHYEIYTFTLIITIENYLSL